MAEETKTIAVLSVDGKSRVAQLEGFEEHADISALYDSSGAETNDLVYAASASARIGREIFSLDLIRMSAVSAKSGRRKRFH